MSMAAGARIGPYEILASLGAGEWARYIAPETPGSIASWP
jgi:hypothetical protein